MNDETGKANPFEEEVPQFDMSSSGSAKKAEEPELIRANAISIEQNTTKQPRLDRNSYLAGEFEELIRAKDVSIENGWRLVRGNAPPRSMEFSSTISDTSERLIRAGDISIEPMAPHDDCETSDKPMFPVSQLGNYQADDGLVACALDRNDELNPGSTTFNVPVLFVDKSAVQSANLSMNKTGTLSAVDPGFSSPFLSRVKIKTSLLLGNFCESRTIIKETVDPNNCHQRLVLDPMREAQNIDYRKETLDTNNCHQICLACLTSVAGNSMIPEDYLDCTTQNILSPVIAMNLERSCEAQQNMDIGHWKAGLLQVNHWKEALGMHNSSCQGSKGSSLYQACRIACLMSDEVNIMRPEGSLRPSICIDALISTSHVSSTTQGRKPDCPLLEGNHANYLPNILESHFHPESVEVGSLPSFAFRRMTLGTLIKAMITAAQIAAMYWNFSYTRQIVEQNDTESLRKFPTVTLSTQPRSQQTMPIPHAPIGAVGTAPAVFSISSPTTGEAAPTVRLFPPHPGEC